jgi:hypothetical protein
MIGTLIDIFNFIAAVIGYAVVISAFILYSEYVNNGQYFHIKFFGFKILYIRDKTMRDNMNLVCKTTGKKWFFNTPLNLRQYDFYDN